MNTVEFKSATFPNAGSRHLLDDSVMESHSPTRGQAESSTLSSGISLGKCEIISTLHPNQKHQKTSRSTVRDQNVLSSCSDLMCPDVIHC